MKFGVTLISASHPNWIVSMYVTRPKGAVIRGPYANVQVENVISKLI